MPILPKRKAAGGVFHLIFLFLFSGWVIGEKFMDNLNHDKLILYDYLRILNELTGGIWERF